MAKDRSLNASKLNSRKLLCWLLSVLVTALLCFLLFRPGIFHMIGYTLWLMLGRPFDEITFVYLFDGISALLILFLVYSAIWSKLVTP